MPATSPAREPLLNEESFGSHSGRRKASVSFVLVKWLVPAFVNAASLFVCMWLLHIATYFYVIQMSRIEQSYMLPPPANSSIVFAGPHGSMSPGLTHLNASFGSLEDPLEGFIGWRGNMNIHVLDGLALAFPVLWGIGTLWTNDLHLWTKVVTANAMLALGKGVIGIATIVPDSSGWAVCKERLGNESIAFLRQEIPNPFVDGFSSTAWALFQVELRGPHHDRLGSGMRFCADMMYSGHTYFTCLYAIGLLELTRRRLVIRNVSATKRTVVLAFVVVVCVAQQAVEISLVIMSRFHYTMDVLLAVIITLLWYTNGPLVLFSQWWASLFQKEFYAYNRIENDTMHVHNEKDSIRAEGDLYIPPCCLPFWCLARGYHHFFSTRDFGTFGGNVTNIEPSESFHVAAQVIAERDQRTKKVMQRKWELTSQIASLDQQIDALSNENDSLRTTILGLEGPSQVEPSKWRICM